jgi:STAS domain-containing protein
MDITTERPRPDVAVIALAGELDGSNFEHLIDAGRAARDAGATRIVLDLGGLTYMGSSGLVAIHSIALLLRGQEPVSPEDGWQAIHDIGRGEADGEENPLVLAAAPPSVHRVLDRSGMLGLIPAHPDVDAALTAIGA